MIVRHVTTSIHGRFLHVDRGTDRLLVGFHGYAETAETHLEQLEQIPGIGEWSLVSVQALHPFYTRAGVVVASWMTKLDRELAIEDNLAYARRVLESVARPRILVFAGFSQGAPMAIRATAFARANPAGLIILGGDIPPEVSEDESVKLPPVLLGRGSRDEWYTDEKFKKDLSYLETKTRVTRCVFAGGHEWTGEFRDACAQFLRGIE
jgi:predicted esterase